MHQPLLSKSEIYSRLELKRTNSVPSSALNSRQGSARSAPGSGPSVVLNRALDDYIIDGDEEEEEDEGEITSKEEEEDDEDESSRSSNSNSSSNSAAVENQKSNKQKGSWDIEKDEFSFDDRKLENEESGIFIDVLTLSNNDINFSREECCDIYIKDPKLSDGDAKS